MKLILSVFFSLCWFCVYIYAILLLFGIGGKALAGYHTSTNETKARKEHKCILRKAGICILLISIIAHAMCLLFIFEQYILGGVAIALLIISSILSVYALNNQKMIEKENKVKETTIHNKEESKDEEKG